MPDIHGSVTRMGESDKQPGSEEHKGSLAAITKYIEPDMQAIIDDWNAGVDNDVTGMPMAHKEVITRLVYIPLDEWRLIPVEQLPLVQARWERYTTERKLFIIEDTDKMNICLARSHQGEYVRSIC